MISRDPEPGDAPEGESAASRFPAPSASFERSAEPFARQPADGSPDDPAAAPVTDSTAVPPPADTVARHATRRTRWQAWRGSRPFLGGMLMTLGGVEVLLTERASIGVVVHIGMQGLSGYLIPAVLVVCGLLTIFSPAQRLFYSVLGVLLSLGSWLTSNLGGFFVGLLLGVIGSCLAFGWLPDQTPRQGLRKRLRARKPARP